MQPLSKRTTKIVTIIFFAATALGIVVLYESRLAKLNDALGLAQTALEKIRTAQPILAYSSTVTPTDLAEANSYVSAAASPDHDWSPNGKDRSSDIEKLLGDIESNAKADRYDLFKDAECWKNDEKYRNIVLARHKLIAFHNNLKGGSDDTTATLDNNVNFELLFHRDAAFVAEVFLLSANSLVHNEKFINDTNSFLDFAIELVKHKNGITSNPKWKEILGALLKSQPYNLARAEPYYESGFPRSENACLQAKPQNDYSIDAWMYGFWLRRFSEGNMELVGRILDWWVAFRSNNNPKIELTAIEDYAKTFAINITHSEESKAHFEQPIFVDCHDFAFDATYFGAETRGDTVAIDAMAKIDWQKYAPAHLRQLDPKKIHYKMLAQLRQNASDYGTAYLSYTAPVSCPEIQKTFTFVSPNQQSVIRLSHILGQVRFSISQRGAVESGPSYGGYIIGDGIGTLHSGDLGFVFVTDKPISPSTLVPKSIKLGNQLFTITPSVGEDMCWGVILNKTIGNEIQPIEGNTRCDP